MKKLVILAIAVALPLAGCCTRINPETKISTKSFSNCLDTAQQILCDPTPSQQAAAGAALQFITSGVAVAGLVTNVPITVEQVELIFSVIQSGGCILVTDLQKALAWYAALTATVETQARMSKGLKGMAAPPNVDALYNW